MTKPEREKICLNQLVYALKGEAAFFDVFHQNGIYLGTFEYGTDGYLNFWPSKREGYWSAPSMREIANLLDFLNAPWDKQVSQDLAKVRNTNE